MIHSEKTEATETRNKQHCFPVSAFHRNIEHLYINRQLHLNE